MVHCLDAIISVMIFTALMMLGVSMQAKSLTCLVPRTVALFSKT